MVAAYNPKKLADARSIRMLFFISWVTYVSTYVGRLNFSASMGEMIIAGNFTKSELGLVGAVFFFAYGIGQFISGILGDKVAPKQLVFIGVSTSSILNLAMGVSSSYEAMIVLWSLNGLMQSLTWSPIARLISDRLPRKECFKAFVNLSTTVPAGTLLTYFMCSMLIEYSNWRMVFILAAILMFPVAVIWYVVISKLEYKAESDGFAEEDDFQSAVGRNTLVHKTSFHTVFLASGLLMISIGAMLHGILKDGIMTWLPTYLAEGFNTSSSLAIRLTMVLPIINLAGVYISNYFNRKIFMNELVTAAFLFVVTVLALLMLIIYGQDNLLISLIMLGIVTSAMLGVNSMLVSLVPLYFSESRRVSTISGMLNSTTYLGSAISSYGVGAIAQQFGWGITRSSWCIMATVGAVICMISSNKWRNFTKQS